MVQLVQASEPSIGTLTGWQLLAGQVMGSARGTDTLFDSCVGAVSEHSSASSMEVPAAAPRLAQALRSSNGDTVGSAVSDRSDATTSSHCSVTPRPQYQLFAEYQLLDQIGAGGFGRVFRAQRLVDGEMVVVKEIKTATLSAKQKAATMDEVQVLASLQHPHIVRYHDCFTDDSTMHIVMEYCGGGDLAAVLKRRQGQLLSEAEVMRHFIQILLALQEVHRQGILHRDLKTSNVLVSSRGLLHLGDFGVSKISNADFSMASTIVGTPQYLSPEMCDNKPYGKKSDIWALGCVLCELCTLQKAFEGSSITKIILSIMSGCYNRPSSSYSPELHSLLESCWRCTQIAVRLWTRSCSAPL